MGIGAMEGILIGSAIFVTFGFFGRHIIKNFFKTLFGIKKDFEDVKKEIGAEQVKN